MHPPGGISLHETLSKAVSSHVSHSPAYLPSCRDAQAVTRMEVHTVFTQLPSNKGPQYPGGVVQHPDGAYAFGATPAYAQPYPSPPHGAPAAPGGPPGGYYAPPPVAHVVSHHVVTLGGPGGPAVHSMGQGVPPPPAGGYPGYPQVPRS